MVERLSLADEGFVTSKNTAHAAGKTFRILAAPPSGALSLTIWPREKQAFGHRSSYPHPPRSKAAYTPTVERRQRQAVRTRRPGPRPSAPCPARPSRPSGHVAPPITLKAVSVSPMAVSLVRRFAFARCRLRPCLPRLASVQPLAFGHAQNALGQNPVSWSGFDPFLPFKTGPVNGRKAQGSGLRSLAWESGLALCWKEAAAERLSCKQCGARPSMAASGVAARPRPLRAAFR